MFSAGVDSTYTLWKLLNEGHNVQTHFIDLHHRRNRYEIEREAVYNVLGWFREKGHKIVHRESVIQFNHRLTNIVTIGYAAIHAYLEHDRLFKKAGIKGDVDVVYGSERDRYEWSREDKKVMMTIFNSYFEYRDPECRKPKLYSVILDTWKADMFKELPQDLLDLTWSCRTPTEDFKPCGKCPSCDRNQRQMRGERIDGPASYRKF